MSAAIAAKPLENAKHEAVLQSYFADPERVGYRCYIAVYPNSSEAAAKTGFSRLLKNADFKARFDFLTAGVAKVVSEKVAISVESVVAELAKIGFANLKDYIGLTADGDPYVRLCDMTEDQAAAVASVTVEDYKDGRGEDARDVKKISFRMHDKKGALIAIGEHLGAFVKRHADPDGRALGTGAAEVTKLSDLEVARRLAFLLSRGAQAKGPDKAPVKTAKKRGS